MSTPGKQLKSAVELAMERLSKNDGRHGLSDVQKTALAEVDRQTKAKLAELEIMGSDRMLKAGGDREKIEGIRAEQRAAMEKIKGRAEEEKERIRAK